MTWLTVMEYMCHRLTRRVQLVVPELLTLPEHLSSSRVFSGVCVTWSLDLCVCFVDRCLCFWNFSFGHLFFDIRILGTPLIYSHSSYYDGCLTTLSSIYHLCSRFYFNGKWNKSRQRYQRPSNTSPSHAMFRVHRDTSDLPPPLLHTPCLEYTETPATFQHLSFTRHV